MKYKLGFIGCGNMGGALVRAASRTVEPEKIAVSGHNAAKAQALADACGVKIEDNAAIARQCEYIFLGVKPQMMGDMLSGIRPELASRKTTPVLVTMAAGLSMENICAMAGGEYPVVRIMPNTPAAIGRGMTLCCNNDKVSSEQLDEVLAALKESGWIALLEESQIDAGSAVSGCGPAFAYMFIEALADGGVKCGLPRNMALTFAAQTIAGAAELMLSTGRHPGLLKDEVCSPGGSTIAGVHALEDRAFRGACIDAVAAAFERTKELGEK